MFNRVLRTLLIATLFFLPVSAWAACGGSSPTWTAASANYSDVLACVTAATYGDTINIPAGSGTGYTTSIVITKDLHIVGAGIGSTTITFNFTANNVGPYSPNTDEAIFWFQPNATANSNIRTLASSGTIEVSGINFVYDGSQT